MRDTEGYLASGAYKIWYRHVGGENATHPPLLVLHGGPGAPSDYLHNLDALATPERSVIFYDQLGCGRSDQPDDPSLWTVPHFVEELAGVRQQLGLDRVHILGQSWGGMLAMEYMLTQPQGVVSLILSNTTPSIPLWVAEANRLRKELPPGVDATLTQHETAGTTDSQEYEAAVRVYYDRHLCRVPWPDFVQRSMDNIGVVYNTMNGPSEFFITGIIKDWDIRQRLNEIHVPTLIISGRYDESTPVINEIMRDGIAGSRWVVLEESSHLSNVEEPEAYRTYVQDFLSSLE